jgi:hypothetical protein
MSIVGHKTRTILRRDKHNAKKADAPADENTSGTKETPKKR